uniref:Tc1-like transposase DDE domain-containing protein n=1 Tax=Timema douglasi TaxID=61478 RepID=A0A7R8VDG0_TIMDO|nr:unnamed protein product [Timema douglasi]
MSMFYIVGLQLSTSYTLNVTSRYVGNTTDLQQSGEATVAINQTSQHPMTIIINFQYPSLTVQILATSRPSSTSRYLRNDLSQEFVINIPDHTVLRDTMTGIKYVLGILEPIVSPCRREVGLHLLIADDNAPPHGAQVYMPCPERNDIVLMYFPVHSLHRDPIEYGWEILKQTILSQHTLSKTKLPSTFTPEPALQEQQCSLYLAVPPSSPFPHSYVRMRRAVKHHVAGTVKRTVSYKELVPIVVLTPSLASAQLVAPCLRGPDGSTLFPMSATPHPK